MEVFFWKKHKNAPGNIRVRSKKRIQRFLPRKNSASVPGPEWEPMTAPV